jgi:hypothetical protein
MRCAPSDPAPGTVDGYMYVAIRPPAIRLLSSRPGMRLLRGVYTVPLLARQATTGNMTPSTLCGESTRLDSSAAVVLDK